MARNIEKIPEGQKTAVEAVDEVISAFEDVETFGDGRADAGKAYLIHDIDEPEDETPNMDGRLVWMKEAPDGESVMVFNGEMDEMDFINVKKDASEDDIWFAVMEAAGKDIG